MSRLAEGDLLTVPQALRLVPIGRSRMYRLVKDGLIPSIPVPTARRGGRGSYLIRRANLERFINELEQDAQEEPEHDPETIDDILDRIEDDDGDGDETEGQA